MDLTNCASPSLIMSRLPVEGAREFCCSQASAVITKLFYAIFIFIFAVFAATLGALTGAFKGAKTKIGCLRGATVGAIKGSFFSIKLLKISFVVCSSDDMATSYFLQMNAFPSTFNGGPWNERSPKDSIKNIPKARITEENLRDSSMNTISCSICLQEKNLTDAQRKIKFCFYTRSGRSRVMDKIPHTPPN